MIKTATKKPVTIEFIEWTGENVYSIGLFCGRYAHMENTCESGEVLVIKTLDGQHMAT